MTILLNPQFTASRMGTSPPKTTRQRPRRARNGPDSRLVANQEQMSVKGLEQMYVQC